MMGAEPPDSSQPTSSSGWWFLFGCGFIAVVLCGGAAIHGAGVTGLQIGEDMNVLFYIFGGWLLGLLVTPVILYMVRRRHALFIAVATLILPLLVAFSAGAAANRIFPVSPLPFRGTPHAIPHDELAKQFADPLAPPAPGPVLEGHSLGGYLDYSLIFHVRATPGSVPGYIEQVRAHYVTEGYEITTHSGLAPMPEELATPAPQRIGTPPLKVNWWQPQNLSAPQTLEIRRNEEGIWIWYSPKSDELYYHFWSS